MRRTRFWRIAIVCMGMVLAIWACANPISGLMSDEATEEPVEEAVEETEEAAVEEEAPTPTAEPTPEPQSNLPQEYRNEGAGFSMSLPEEWIVQDFFIMTYAAPSEEALAQLNGESEGGDELPSPVIMAMIAPPDEEGLEVDSVEDLNDQMMEEFEPEEGMTISEPVNRTVGGLEAISIDMSGTDPDTGQEIYVRMISVMGPQHAGVFMGASPMSDWENFEPTFEEIIGSVEFFEPDPDALLEDFGEDFGEGFDEEGMGIIPDEATSTDSIEPGDQVSTTLEDNAVHAWTFGASAGDSITITVTPETDDLDAVLQLLSPDGTVLVEMNDGFSGEPEVVTYTVAEAGTYTALVRGFAMFGGPYTILLQTGAGSGGQSSQTDGDELRQWAISATASSEYSDPDWAASQATGAPDTYPECGDIPTAWASAFSDGVDTITLNYATPVIPTRMEIYQTLNPGAISKVELIDTSGTSHIIYVGDPKVMDVCPYIMVLSITGVNEPINQVIIHVDQSTTGYWNEIDAVELIGIP